MQASAQEERGPTDVAVLLRKLMPWAIDGVAEQPGTVRDNTS